MQSFLMRQGVEERDYTKEIPLWDQLAKAIAQSDEAAEQAAFRAVLNAPSGHVISSPSKSSQSAVKVEHAPQKAESTRVAELAMARSRRAYGYLYGALPADLRPLIADVPQGYAFGIWSYLEKKFRNTEQDSVLALWREFATMQQSDEESFDEYKARVDAMKELLTNAKQKVEPALYASLLIWNLTGKYSTVVLSLKTSEKLKDVSNVDWPSIRAIIADYERSHTGLANSSDPSLDRGLAARGFSSSRSHVGRQQARGSKDRRGATHGDGEVTCFRCGKDGHRVADCYSRKHKDGSALPDSNGKGGSNKGPNRRDKFKKRRNDADSDESGHSAHLARNSQRSDSEEDSDSGHGDDEAPKARSYAAIVLSGLAMAGNTRHASQKSRDTPPVSPRSTEVAYAGSSAAAAASASSSSASSAQPKPAVKAKDFTPLDTLLRTRGKAIDTGATAHMTGNRDSLANIKRCAPMPIKMADGNIILAVYKGELNIRLNVEDKNKELKQIKVKVPDVYYHERFDANLLSWGKMRKAGWKLASSSSGTFLTTPGGNKAVASTRGDLTIIEDCAQEIAYSVRSVKSVVEAKQLVAAHRRLGHISWTRLEKLCKSGSVVGIPTMDTLPDKELELAKKEIQECEACVQGKSAGRPVGHRGLDKGTRPGQVIHMDTFYVTRRDERTGKKATQYCMLATDGYSEWRWVDVVSSMTQLTDSAISILQHCRSMTDKPVRMIVCDLGSEFNNKKLQNYCDTQGIKLQPAPPRVKELNGLAEKSVDTVKNHTRAMLHAVGIKNGSEYAMALSHHIYLWNRTQIGQRSGMTPYEAMVKRKADTSHTGEFGCDAFVVQHRSQRDTTFDAKAEPGIYLGHDGRSNCARIRMLDSGKVVIAKDVILREGKFTHLATRLQGREAETGATTTRIPHLDLYDASDIESDIDESEQNESEVEAEEEPRYEVEQVTHSRIKAGVRQYRVKWVGYDEATWEPASVIEQDAPEEAKQFEETQASVLSDRATRRSARLQKPSDEATSSAASNTDNDSAIGLAAMEAASCL